MTQEQTATYRTALKEARAAFDKASERLSQITFESGILNDEITRLRRTITALAALCSEIPGIDALGITDACMEVMQTYKSTVTTADVVCSLESMGFDVDSQKNAAASVHAVLSRLARSGKITRIQDEESDAVSWRGPNYDQKVDSGEWATGITDADIPF